MRSQTVYSWSPKCPRLDQYSLLGRLGRAGRGARTGTTAKVDSPSRSCVSTPKHRSLLCRRSERCSVFRCSGRCPGRDCRSRTRFSTAPSLKRRLQAPPGGTRRTFKCIVRGRRLDAVDCSLRSMIRPRFGRVLCLAAGTVHVIRRPIASPTLPHLASTTPCRLEDELRLTSPFQACTYWSAQTNL